MPILGDGGIVPKINLKTVTDLSVHEGLTLPPLCLGRFKALPHFCGRGGVPGDSGNPQFAAGGVSLTRRLHTMNGYICNLSCVPQCTCVVPSVCTSFISCCTEVIIASLCRFSFSVRVCSVSARVCWLV